nr:MAG TPA: hypothetical protein [Caudoviricetes sp.]
MRCIYLFMACTCHVIQFYVCFVFSTFCLSIFLL